MSLCLLGVKCRYNARDAYLPEIYTLSPGTGILGICPEVMAGLDIPRQPLEIKGRIQDIEKSGTKILSLDNKDYTLRLLDACKNILEVVKILGVSSAVLKSLSSLCSPDRVYDGSFKGRTKKGRGLLAYLLEKEGLGLFSDEEIRRKGIRILR